MNTLLPFRAFVCAVVLFGATLPAASAADDATPTTPAPMKDTIISIDFPGGSVTKFVASLPKTDGPALSIVGEAADMATELPAFSIRNADVAAVVQAVRALLNARNFQLMMAPSKNNSIIATLVRNSALERRAAVDFESFQLSPFLGQQSIDDVVGAIRTAWEMDPAHDKEALHLKFHPPTSILLVSGPESSLNVARKVLGQLKRAPARAIDDDAGHSPKK